MLFDHLEPVKRKSPKYPTLTEHPLHGWPRPTVGDTFMPSRC